MIADFVTDTTPRCSLPPNHLGPHRCVPVEPDADVCGDYLTWQYRERVPCSECGFVSIRKIRHPDDQSLCSVCTVAGRAARHESEALRLRLKAAGMKAKRSMGREKKRSES